MVPTFYSVAPNGLFFGTFVFLRSLGHGEGRGGEWGEWMKEGGDGSGGSGWGQLSEQLPRTVHRLGILHFWRPPLSKGRGGAWGEWMKEGGDGSGGSGWGQFSEQLLQTVCFGDGEGVDVANCVFWGWGGRGEGEVDGDNFPSSCRERFID